MSSRWHKLGLCAVVLLSGCSGGNVATASQPVLESLGAGGSDITSDLQARVDAGGVVTIPRGRYAITSPITVRGNNTRIVGDGAFNGGSWVGYAGTGAAFVFDGCQHCSIENVWITGDGVADSTGIRFKDTFVGEADNVRIDQMGNGIDVFGATETVLDEVTLRSLHGSYGVRFSGDATHKSYRAVIDDLRADNPRESMGDAGDAVTWILHDSYAYSLVVDKAAVLNGGYGYRMTDSISDGQSYPMWLFATDLETDHNQHAGLMLEHGEGVQVSTSWLGSTLAGDAVHIGSGFRGEVSIGQSRIMGASGNGVYIGATRDVLLTGNQIGDNGGNGVVLDGTYTASIIGNRIGDLVGVAGNSQEYGIYQTGAVGELVTVGNILSGNSFEINQFTR